MTVPLMKCLTFSLIITFLSGCRSADQTISSYGAVIRGDTTVKEISLVFTGDEFGDGASFIADALKGNNIKASFFLTGNFYRNKEFAPAVRTLIKNGNYLGSHSDRHLLYCDWIKRDSLLITKEEFMKDIRDSFEELKRLGISTKDARFFLPPYEWYNDSISAWSRQMGLVLVNFTPGTGSNADYTYPEMGDRYRDSRSIYNSVLGFEKKSSNGLNGFILLIHIGTDQGRTDKFYSYLPALIRELKARGYKFVRIDEMLN
jgi:endoglucanase